MKNSICTIFVLFLLFAACKKHDKAPSATSEPCTNYNDPALTILSDDTLRSAGVFNPLNANEIAYIRLISAGIYDLSTYNLTNKTFTQKRLPSAVTIVNLFWNSKNAFTYQDTSWVINSDNKQPFVLKDPFKTFCL